MGEPKKVGNRDFLGFLFGKLTEPLEKVVEQVAKSKESEETKDSIDTTAEVIDE